MGAGTSPVRIREQDKLELERLREAWVAETGQRPTQEELLARVLAFALRHRAEFLAEATWKPLSKKQIEALLAAAEDLGPWGIEDIDDIVYGQGA